MLFVKFLREIGDRLGILESVAAQESVSATRIRTRTVSLRELAIEIRSVEVKALADSKDEFTASFERIFEAAGITLNPEAWTMDRLKQVIQAESAQNKSRDEVQKAVLDLLKSEGVSSEILVKDAIARDQALDAFEARVNEVMKERNQACERRLTEIAEQMKTLQDESARIMENRKADEEKWREWRKAKQAQERELASNVGYLVDHPVVTTSEEA